LTDFESPLTDIYGFTSNNEDNLLPFGNKDATGGFGITGSETAGEGYGYMVKYPKTEGVFPQGTWVRYGFDNNELDTGDGVPDFTAPPPPPSPKLKISYNENDVIIEWSSHELFEESGNIGASGSEHFKDPFTGKVDFEGYQIMVSQTQFAQDYVEVYSTDRKNFVYENVATKGQYLADPIPADTLAAHPEDYPATKIVNGKIWQLVPFGENRSMYENYEKQDLFSYTATPDTNYIEEVGVIWNYKFVLKNKILADEFFIAVTASDFGDAKSETPPLKLQYLITEALQDQHHFGSVISGTSMASNNLVLEPIIQNFEEVFREDGTSYVHVSIRFRLVEIKTGEVLGSIKLSSKRDVTNTHGAEGAVEAFNTATEDVIKSLSIWINELRK